ncbi:peroxidase-related enzyme [Microbacterium betulae]|uniref:Peroxidase-related enzyme n=1 Tax=Microbacterium betulae TaxID=2981139 RepID=A0AA97I7B6_9MICO|nr:peroxidase-related enzyme [Microbacterium sp. AB]WOF23447.1 peroxidase-related enzyme [Microbacterium sp. AB]
MPVTPGHPSPSRSGLVRLVHDVDRLVLTPPGPSPLPVRTRLRIGLRTAGVNAAATLGDRLAAELRARGWGADVLVVSDAGRWGELDEREGALLELCDQMAVDPSDLDGDDVLRLRGLGVSSAAIVAAAQAVAYASFRARLDAGLALLGRSDGRPSASPSEPATPPLRRILPEGAGAFPVLAWRPWVEPGDPPRTPGDGLPATLTPFYRTLAHEPEVLAARTALYDAIMTGEGELPRADRELVALVTSLTTGCEYCAGVHGRRHIQLSGDRATAVRLAASGSLDGAGLDARRAALAILAARSASTPSALDGDDLARLSAAGLSAAETAEAIAVAALFAWANRLMMALGAPRA